MLTLLAKVFAYRQPLRSATTPPMSTYSIRSLAAFVPQGFPQGLDFEIKL